MEVWSVDHSAPEPSTIKLAAGALQAGRLVAFPTETVYGLGALLSDSGAIRALFEEKGRPTDKPFSLLVPSIVSARHLARVWPVPAEVLGAALWPGPLTLVVESSDAVPLIVRANRPTVGLRVPDHPVVLALLDAVGEPIVASSANRSGQPPAVNATEVVQAFQSATATTIAGVIDGGESEVGSPSTVVDVTGPKPTILRAGAIDQAELFHQLSGAS